MQVMKGTRTAIALATIAVALAPGALAQRKTGSVQTALTKLIDPPPADAVQDGAEPSTAEIKKVLLELLQLNDGGRVKMFGESAGPALRELIEEGGLEQLTRSSGSNPMALLVEYAPLEALEFFSEAQRGPTFRYEALIRSPYSLDDIMNAGVVTGESQALMIDVLDRTLASPTLDLDTKLWLAVAAHSSNLGSARAIRLIRENAEYAATGGRDLSKQIYDAVVPAGTVPPVDLPERIAWTLIDKRPTIEVLEPLSQSPHARVRSKVGEAIRDEWRNGLLPRDRTVAILTRLSADDDPEVISWTTGAVSTLLSNSGISLTIDDLTALVAGLANRPSDTNNLAQALAMAIHQTASRTAESDAAKVEVLYRTAFASQMTSLHERLRTLRRAGVEMPLGCAVAYFRATDSLSRPYRDAAADVVSYAVRRREPWTPARAAAVLDVLMSDGSGGDLGAYVLEETSQESSLDKTHNNKPARGAIFKGLAPERVPDAMRWLTSTDVDIKDHYALAFASVTLWPNAGPQLRAITNSTDETTRARVLAGAGLTWCDDVTARDVELYAAYLAECLADPGRRGEVEQYFASRNSLPAANATLLWNDISLALLDDARVPDDFAVTLPLLGNTKSAEQVATFNAVLDAAERRAQANGSLYFLNMSYFALEAMARGQSEVRPALLRSWLLESRYADSDGITVVLAMENNDAWVTLVLDDLLFRLRSESGHRQQNIANQILRLPGDEPVQRLLEFVMRSESTALVKYVDAAISDRLRIREASLRWSALASGGADLDTAKIKVMRLLESDNPAVKTAAIRGLGTLGAVEALPVLIELVGSDQPDVRSAALETLDLLNRQAAAKAARPTEGSTGGK